MTLPDLPEDAATNCANFVTQGVDGAWKTPSEMTLETMLEFVTVHGADNLKITIDGVERSYQFKEGEFGPEVVDLPPGSRVHNATNSAQMGTGGSGLTDRDLRKLSRYIAEEVSRNSR